MPVWRSTRRTKSSACSAASRDLCAPRSQPMMSGGVRKAASSRGMGSSVSAANWAPYAAVRSTTRPSWLPSSRAPSRTTRPTGVGTSNVTSFIGSAAVDDERRPALQELGNRAGIGVGSILRDEMSRRVNVDQMAVGHAIGVDPPGLGRNQLVLGAEKNKGGRLDPGEASKKLVLWRVLGSEVVDRAQV